MAWVEEASEGAGMDVRSAAIVLAEYGLCMKSAQLYCESVFVIICEVYIPLQVGLSCGAPLLLNRSYISLETLLLILN